MPRASEHASRPVHGPARRPVNAGRLCGADTGCVHGASASGWYTSRRERGASNDGVVHVCGADDWADARTLHAVEQFMRRLEHRAHSVSDLAPTREPCKLAERLVRRPEYRAHLLCDVVPTQEPCTLVTSPCT